MLVKTADKSAVFDGYLSDSSGTLSTRAPLLMHCFLLHALALSRFFDSLKTGVIPLRFCRMSYIKSAGNDYCRCRCDSGKRYRRVFRTGLARVLLSQYKLGAVLKISRNKSAD